MVDYNTISQRTLDFLEYAKEKSPEFTFITLINPAEEHVTVYAQRVTTTIQRRTQVYTFGDFLKADFEKIRQTLLLKF